MEEVAERCVGAPRGEQSHDDHYAEHRKYAVLPHPTSTGQLREEGRHTGEGNDPYVARDFGQVVVHKETRNAQRRVAAKALWCQHQHGPLGLQ